MTPRQRDTLLFIDMYWEDNACSPSYQEIADKIGVKSKSNINRIILALTKLGYVEHIPSVRRTVRPIRLPEALIKRKLEIRAKEKEQDNG